MTTSSSQVSSSPGMIQQPLSTHSTLGGYNNGQFWRYPVFQNRATNQSGYGTEGSRPLFPFSAQCGATGNSVPCPPGMPGLQGGTPHTLATPGPYPDFLAQQAGGGATRMDYDYSRAVSNPSMGGGAVKTQPQANTDHAGIVIASEYHCISIHLLIAGFLCIGDSNSAAKDNGGHSQEKEGIVIMSCYS